MDIRELAIRSWVGRVCTADKGGSLERAWLVGDYWGAMAVARAYNRAQRASGHGHAGGEHNQIGNTDRAPLGNFLELAGNILEAVVLRAIKFLSEDERAVTAAGLALVKRPRATIVKH